MNELDRILFSTNLFFDPSIVEMFLAMYCGAELIIIPTDFTAKSFLLEKVILTVEKLSFAQFTPAVLQRFSNNFLRNLFGSNAPIRNILIGGEVFPLNLIRFYCSENCTANIFNVYGITEVSCWATCHKFVLTARFFNFYFVYLRIELVEKNNFVFYYTKILDKFNFNFSKNEKKDLNLTEIGEPLLNTTIQIDNEGVILIGGSRKCFINFDFDLQNNLIQTEDVSIQRYCELNSTSRIFVRGRKVSF